MAKITVPKLEASTFRGWTFVIVAGVVLAFLAIIDRGGLGETTSDGSTTCRLEVQATTLNIRTGPSLNAQSVDTLHQGDVVDGTAVVTDGFRQLESGRWADNAYLTPLPDSSCS